MCIRDRSRGDDRAPPPIARGESEGSQGGVMVYTSGTTGKPKGAHRDFEATGVQEALHFLLKFPLSHQDRHLAVCPLYHSAAPFFTGMTFLVGGTVVLERHFEPEQILGLIARERVTSSMMVPTMLNRLVAVGPEVLARHDTSSLRWLGRGAAGWGGWWFFFTTCRGRRRCCVEFWWAPLTLKKIKPP